MYPHVHHQTNQPILNVSHLTLRYGNIEALRDASFQLHTGDLVAVVGPNGAGKSSLFKALAGILNTSQGEIQVYGSQPGGHICIAYLPQRSHFDWSFPVNVADVVMMGRIAKLGLFGWPKKADWEFVHRSLETVGLANIEKKQIGQLSGGQQQRMLIARALAQEAELILMDEPLTGLDTPSQEDLLVLLGNLKQKGVTVMVATHDLDQAVSFFDLILLLNQRVITFGTASKALTPETLSQAYGGRLRIENGKIIPDTCCDGDQHE
jgi:manganese/iron transport system ATP-binding protein